MKNLFTNDELEKIKEAVRVSEEGNNAEIVPVFFLSSGKYPEAVFKGILFSFLLFSSSIQIILSLFYDSFLLSIESFFIFQIISLILGFSFLQIPSVKRFFTTKKDRNRNVLNQSYKCFVENEIFATKNRTGILLFMSFFEREVVILADKGIYKYLNPNSWTEITEKLVSDMKSKPKTESILLAIESLSKLVKNLPKEMIIENELKNDLRIGDANV
jgi:putative membrane protein